MKRNIYQTLCDWEKVSNHKPLLLRGARQIGKTYVINEFGQKEFDEEFPIISLPFYAIESFLKQ